MHRQRGATILNDAGTFRTVLILPRWSKVSPADRSACRVRNCTGEFGRIRWDQLQGNSASAGAVWQKSALDLTFRFLHAPIGPNSRRVNPYRRFLYLQPTPNFLPKSRLLLFAEKTAAIYGQNCRAPTRTRLETMAPDNTVSWRCFCWTPRTGFELVRRRARTDDLLITNG